MTQPPQVNSTLTQVTGPGLSERYDRPAGAGPVKWRGTSGAYVREAIRSVFNPQGALDRIQEVTLYIDAELPMTPSLRVGDTMSYTYRDQDFTAKAQMVISPTLPGTPRYTRVVLEEVNAT